MDPKREYLKKQARELYETKPLTLVQIADMLEINPSTLRRWKYEDSEREDPWLESFTYRKPRITRRSARLAREWESWRRQREELVTEGEQLDLEYRRLKNENTSQRRPLSELEQLQRNTDNARFNRENRSIPTDFNERVNMIFNLQNDLMLKKRLKIQYLKAGREPEQEEVERTINIIEEELEELEINYPEEFKRASE